MSRTISFKNIKTRKTHTCLACGDLIKEKSEAWSWIYSWSGIHTVYMHYGCGEDVYKHCLCCKRCYNFVRFPSNFMLDNLLCGGDCEPCKRLKKTLEIADELDGDSEV